MPGGGSMACASLGSASDISIFLFGNYNNQFTTLSGRVAAGGNVIFTDQVISSALPVSTTRADLIIGGSVDITRGFNNGNTIISPTSTVITYTMINNNGVTPQPIVDTPIDFASSQAYLQCLSTGWGALSPNGTATNTFGNLQITGTDPTLNIITFNGNDVDGTGLSL
jgi:choice-of-anchor A domain-containing protein